MICPDDQLSSYPSPIFNSSKDATAGGSGLPFKHVLSDSWAS